MIDAITAPNTAKNRALLMFTLRWDQDGHRVADGLLGQIAKEPLRPPVPARGDGIKVRAYYCVITGFDNRSKPPKLLPTLAQRLFHPVALNQVRGLSGEHVQWLQLAFRGAMRPSPVG
jgi:hypothetical protein